MKLEIQVHAQQYDGVKPVSDISDHILETVPFN